MLFEVKKDGVVKFSTTDESCVPDKETRKQMREAGYKLYKDGKVFKD